eukprot:TRINITY_DN41570_c0_g1_i1.p1 TRINITY_DN41570_c0_g1~~TRINITY_DN41570_c0_g1_i1.p1  ORF type:complete len:767 (-),score=132.58 TRINITY_DN41570_c0_g1_i1:396-2696(-)
MQLQLQEHKIRCGTLATGLLLLLAIGLLCPALFLPFWDGGSAKELFNLEDAPPVMSSLWSISFNNPPPEFAKPKRRDSSTWDEYCAAQAKKPESRQSASSFISEVNGTVAGSSNATSSNIGNETSANRSGSRKLRPREGDPSLPDSACFLVTTSRMMMVLSPSLSSAAFITIVAARMRMSVLIFLLGAFFSGLSAAAAFSAVMLVSLLGITGLPSGLGTQLVLLAMCSAMAATCVAIWASAKAVQPLPEVMRAAGGEAETDSEEELDNFNTHCTGKLTAEEDANSRLDRMRKARKRELRKFGNARAAGTDAIHGDGHHVTVSADKIKKIRQIIDDSIPYSLMRIFQWGEKPGEGGRFGPEVPDEFIQNAFLEVDEDESGAITLEEFMMAVRRLGLEPSEEAFKAILAQVDDDESGMMEYSEFYHFFRTLEHTIRQAQIYESQARMTSLVCQLCFFVHIIIISVTVIMSSRRPPATEELDDIKKAERNLVDLLIKVIAVNLCILFWCVVGIPMVRFSLGRSLVIWTTLVAEALYSCCFCRRSAPVQALVVPDEIDLEAGKTSQAIEDHAELPPLRESEEIDSMPEESRSPASRRQTKRYFGSRVRRKTIRRSERLAQRPWWKRLLSRRSKEFRKSIRVSVRRTKASTYLRATTKRGSIMPQRLTVSVLGDRRTKRRKSREEEWFGSAEGQYNPQKFQEANRMYMEALSAPISTFTPMQVRNLSYRPPDPSSPLPPEETHVPILFLPGMTDSSFRERQLERSGSQYSQ